MMYSAEVWPRGVEKGELNMLKHDVFIGSMTGGSFRVDLYSQTQSIHRKNNRGEFSPTTNIFQQNVFIGRITAGNVSVNLYSPTKCIHRKYDRGECIVELIFSNKMYS